MFGIGVGAMALIIVLSAFNGIDSLVRSLYSSFDAELRIEAAEGKFIDLSEFPLNEIQLLEEVEGINRSLEETVLLRNGNKQAFATIKGVDTSFLSMSGMDSIIYIGEPVIYGNVGEPRMIYGYLVANKLGLSEINYIPINVYAANKDAKASSMSMNAFYTEPIQTAGVFSVNIDFDTKYVIAPRSFTEKLLQVENIVSAIEINFKEDNASEMKDKISAIIGDKYVLKTRYEQNELLFKTNKTEKYFTYLILLFILMIATFNIIGSLSMLIIDKTEDIFILRSLGANNTTIRKAFQLEGILIGAIGGSVGIVLGLLVSWLQQKFGLVRLEGMLVDAYPIEIQFGDVAVVALTVFILGSVAAFLPSKWLIQERTLNR